MNCTRTGGWVTSSGRCSSPGGRNVAPLKLDSGHQQQGRAAVREEARDRATTAATSSAATRATGSAGPATRATAGPRTSAAGRAAPRRRARLAPLLPVREVVQRRPLREHDERASTTGSASASGCRRPGPPGRRLLPPLTGTIGRGDRSAVRRSATMRRMIRNAVPPPQQRAAAAGRPVRAARDRRRRPALHEPAHDERQATGLRRRLGTRSSSSRTSTSGSSRSRRVALAGTATRPADAGRRSRGGADRRRRLPPRTEADLEIDEDFLRRIREV